jgi:SP family general alpha glucoside:H+ symporter-like MFS transporter
MNKGREDDARKVIVRLFGKDVDVEERLRVITSELEMMNGEAHNASQTRWKAIFSKEHRSRTLVAILGL